MKNLFAKIKTFKYEIIFFIFCVAVRVPDLGHDTFNTDVWKWKSRTYNFGQGVFTANFSETLQKYHPGVTLMWLGTAGVKVYNLYYDIALGGPPKDNDVATLFQLHFVQKLFIVLAISFALTSVFHVLKNLFGLGFSSLSMVLLSLEPFVLGLTREMHLEGLMTSFMLASVMWFYSYRLCKKKSHFILSALFAGISLLTKTSAVFVVLFVGLYFILDIVHSECDRKIVFKKMFFQGLQWLGFVLLVFVLLWPAMWVNPLGTLSELYRGVSEIGVETEHIQYYFGKLVEDPGPTFYPVVIALRSSVYLIIGLIFFSFLVPKYAGKKERDFVKYLLLFVLLYVVQFTIPTKKLDRYILPAIGALSIISSFSFYWIYGKFKNIKLLSKVVIGVLFFSPLIYIISIIHPDYLSYYNPMFGGLNKGIYVLEPKWMIGAREVTNYFENLKKAQNIPDAPTDASFEELVSDRSIKNYMTVGFPEKYYTQIWPFFREKKSWAVIEDLGEFAKRTRYFVYPVWEDYSNKETRFKLEYVDDIKIRGVPVYKVYKRII